jgi:hypothetical protein
MEGNREMLRAAITGSVLVAMGGAFGLSSSGHTASAAPVTRSTAAAHASAAASYTAVASALTEGKDVEITTELQQCTSPDGALGPDIIGGLHISAFQIVPGQEIAFSDTHQTLDPQNESITQFIRYTVIPNGATTVATTTLSASGQVESTVTLNCRIGKGAYFHWSATS